VAKSQQNVLQHVYPLIGSCCGAPCGLPNGGISTVSCCFPYLTPKASAARVMQIEFTLLRPGLRVPGDDNVVPLLRHQHPSVSDRKLPPKIRPRPKSTSSRAHCEIWDSMKMLSRDI
jgi:hypothetical protein